MGHQLYPLLLPFPSICPKGLRKKIIKEDEKAVLWGRTRKRVAYGRYYYCQL